MKINNVLIKCNMEVKESCPLTPLRVTQTSRKLQRQCETKHENVKTCKCELSYPCDSSSLAFVVGLANFLK